MLTHVSKNVETSFLEFLEINPQKSFKKILEKCTSLDYSVNKGNMYFEQWI